MHERRFNREIERLRDPERVARMEVERVVSCALEGLNAARTVLDVGTGSGLFAEQFVKSGLTVTGLDANAEMLRVAKQYVPLGTFKEGAAEQLPFPEGSFDLVFMGLLLHEADEPLSRSVKPGGLPGSAWRSWNGRKRNRISVRRLPTVYPQRKFPSCLRKRVLDHLNLFNWNT
jgi:2-polyprenyl-3-methyl-5-hydroxy-6-metoxy-1,4-benzoquinol methylase